MVDEVESKASPCNLLHNKHATGTTKGILSGGGCS